MSWESLQVQVEKSCESQLDEIRAIVKEFEGRQATSCATCSQGVGARQSQETLGIPVNITSYSEYFLALIRRELAKYDADKTGLADHALESAGKLSHLKNPSIVFLIHQKFDLENFQEQL